MWNIDWTSEDRQKGTDAIEKKVDRHEQQGWWRVWGGCIIISGGQMFKCRMDVWVSRLTGVTGP